MWLFFVMFKCNICTLSAVKNIFIIWNIFILRNCCSNNCKLRAEWLTWNYNHCNWIKKIIHCRLLVSQNVSKKFSLLYLSIFQNYNRIRCSCSCIKYGNLRPKISVSFQELNLSIICGAVRYSENVEMFFCVYKFSSNTMLA